MNQINKLVLIVAGVAVLLAFAFAGYMTFREHQYSARIVELQNQVAARDKTIEVQEGVFQKLSLQAKDLNKLLDDKDAELMVLRDQLKKQGSELLTANTIVVKLRKDLQDAKNTAVVVVDPSKPEVKRINIDSEDRFDPFQVTGNADLNCNTNQGSYKINLGQRSPIKFSVVVSQDKDGSWRSSATSSTKLFEVDIGLAAVNPYLFEEKWYEKIGLGVDVGVGTAPGFLGGLGIFYEIGKFEVGPKAWFTATPKGVDPFFGAQLLWHPFKKVR